MRPELRERPCRRCHGTGDDGPSLCRDCLGNGSVCPCHGQPECAEFDQKVAVETAKDKGYPTN